MFPKYIGIAAACANGNLTPGPSPFWRGETCADVVLPSPFWRGAGGEVAVGG